MVEHNLIILYGRRGELLAKKRRLTENRVVQNEAGYDTVWEKIETEIVRYILNCYLLAFSVISFETFREFIQKCCLNLIENYEGAPFKFCTQLT